MKLNSLTRIILIASLSLVAAHAFAIDASQVPRDDRSATGLYFTSIEAANYIAYHPASALFLDIRDPGEIFAVGMPLAIDHNVTFKYIDPTRWDDARKTFGMRNNPDFIRGVHEQLAHKALTHANVIILIGRTGKQAAQAATVLERAGFDKVYSVVDGYRGWQRSGLAWSRKLDRQKVLVK